MSHREEALGKTQDTLERLCLGWPGNASGPPGRAGGSVWDDILSVTCQNNISLFHLNVQYIKDLIERT
ncbi:hypothetical protein L3Q82_016477 [Scortum barcoo]|uniref:Uncharacterized protein n=1 Tax=Scortum barcoo TaxID=214431 RepID=A0ACB8XCV5_9TELE|nr:hypothetical protein L3Q82_016477 [Scortum barcoo]